MPYIIHLNNYLKIWQASKNFCKRFLFRAGSKLRFEPAFYLTQIIIQTLS